MLKLKTEARSRSSPSETATLASPAETFVGLKTRPRCQSIHCNYCSSDKKLSYCRDSACRRSLCRSRGFKVTDVSTN